MADSPSSSASAATAEPAAAPLAAPAASDDDGTSSDDSWAVPEPAPVRKREFNLKFPLPPVENAKAGDFPRVYDRPDDIKHEFSHKPYGERCSDEQKTRINLERLLRCTEKLGGDLKGMSERRKFEAYLRTLEQYWKELEDAKHAEEKLGEYRRRIEALVALIDEGKMMAGSGAKLADSQAHNNTNLSRAQANNELSNRLSATSRMQEQLRSRLMGAGSAAAEGPSADDADAGRAGGSCDDAERSGVDAADRSDAGSSVGGSSVAGAPAASTSSAPAGRPFARPAAASGGGNDAGLQGQIDAQRELQESLISDMAHSVAELKDRSMQARQAVKDDVNTLDSTSGVLDSNQSQLDANNEKLQQQLRSMSSSTCMVWLMLLAVCVLFVGTFLLMKMVPKRPRHPPPAPHGGEL